MSFTRPLMLGLCLLPAVAAAEIRPGLWEFSSRMQSGGEQMPDMQAVLDQLQKLPPEQRQMMEQMLAQKGIRMGGRGVQLCISPERARAGDIPLQDPDSGCRHEITERSAELWKFRFTCPNAQGEGETRFAGDSAFTTTVRGLYDGREGSLQSDARWLGEDCGNLPAR